jgi:hypothetical protein
MDAFRCCLFSFIWVCLPGEVSAITYSQWLAAHFTAEEISDPVMAGENADPDGDNRSNLHEYLSGTDPRLVDGPAGPEAVPAGSGITRVWFRWALNLEDAQPLAQTSGDLRHWITHNSWTLSDIQFYDSYVWAAWEWVIPGESSPAAGAGSGAGFSRLGLLRNVGQSLLFAPSDLIAESAFDSVGVHLRWSDNSPLEEGFSIERQLPGDSQFAVLATVGPDTISYTDPGAAWNTPFLYRVRAMGAGGEVSGPSPVSAVLGTAGDDADGDGLSDAWETLYFGGNANPDADEDGDGLTNRQEYLLRTNPRLADSDGDGVPDGLEDLDGDGISELDEFAFGLAPGMDDTQQGRSLRQYTYDALGRLVIAGGLEGRGPGSSYSYDEEGNLRRVGR